MFDNKNNGLWSGIDMKSRHIRVAYWCIVAVLVLWSAVCLFPVVWIFLSSFKDIKEFLSVPPTFIPKSFNPKKLLQVWNDVHFGRYYINTVIFMCGNLIFSIICNGLGGYVISRLKPKGTKLVFAVITWTMMMPESVGMVPLFMEFVDFPILHVNLTNTYLPMWLAAGASAYNILLFKNYFDSIPNSLIEAARLDGCSNFGIFTRIVLPLSLPIISVVGIFTITGSWDSFLWPYLVLKDDALYTVAVKLFIMKNGSWPMDTYVVSLLFGILPPLIIYLFCQKFIIGGLTQGSVKG